MFQHDSGAYARAYPIFPSSQGTAKSSDSAGEVAGRVIDRLALGRNYNSVKFAIPWHGTFASSVGARVTGRLLHGDSSTPATAFGSTGIVRSFATTTTATSTSHAGVAEFNYDLRTAKRYIQFNVAADLVASSSGSLNYGGVGVFAGADELPPAAQSGPISTTS